jgi:hypothetical protein
MERGELMADNRYSFEDDTPAGRYSFEDDAPKKHASGGLVALAAGAGKGVGTTALGAQRYLGKGLQAVGLEQAGKWLQSDAEQGRARLEAENAPYKESSPMMNGAGSIGGEVLATLPVGGVLAKLASPLLSGTRAAPVLEAIRTGGMRTGLPAATTLGGKAAGLGMRAAGGAVTGGVSAGLVDEDAAGAGAAIGGALPVALAGLGRGGAYLGRLGNSLVEPLTQTGQQRFAGRVLNKFAEGGPTAVNARQIIPDSLPTLAEATGNPGLAGLQRTARDLRPNSFVAREQGNAAARSAAFGDIAGDAGSLEAAALAREGAAKPLYGRAFTADAMRRDLAKGAQEARAPFSGVGLSGKADDLATPGLRELAGRPMFKQAVDDARRLAANKGVELKDPLQSLEGLHYVKLALDDALNPAAKSAMGRNASNAVMGMRDKLADELAEVSPLYGNARKTFADMSQPINEMEALQGLRLTDAQGNMTLQKLQTAIRGLEVQRAAPGVSNAKAIAEGKLRTLYDIRDDLMRQTNSGLGRSAGSSTYQNLATDNILGNLLPGKLGGWVTGKVGDVVGQVGKLAYSGANEKIRNSLLDMMLDPTLAERAMSARPGLPHPKLAGLLEAAHPWAYRSAPLLSTDR